MCRCVCTYIDWVFRADTGVLISGHTWKRQCDIFMGVCNWQEVTTKGNVLLTILNFVCFEYANVRIGTIQVCGEEMVGC